MNATSKQIDFILDLDENLTVRTYGGKSHKSHLYKLSRSQASEIIDALRDGEHVTVDEDLNVTIGEEA